MIQGGDYSAGLPILIKWLYKLKNPNVIGSIFALLIPHSVKLDIFDGASITQHLAIQVVRLSALSYDDAQLAALCSEFIKFGSRKRDAALFESLARNKFVQWRSRIYFIDKLSQWKYPIDDDLMRESLQPDQDSMVLEKSIRIARRRGGGKQFRREIEMQLSSPYESLRELAKKTLQRFDDTP